VILSPGSAATLGMRMVAPCSARNCLPPVRKIAYIVPESSANWASVADLKASPNDGLSGVACQAPPEALPQRRNRRIAGRRPDGTSRSVRLTPVDYRQRVATPAQTSESHPAARVRPADGTHPEA